MAQGTAQECEGEHGQALVEFAIVAPVQLLLVLGILQVAYLLVARHVMTYAAHAACRAQLVGRDPQLAAALVCSIISPISRGDGINVPGWGMLPRSPSAIRRTRVMVLSDPGPGEGLVHVRVEHEYRLFVPIANALFAGKKDRNGYWLLMRAESWQYKRWSGQVPQGARGHPWIPDVKPKKS